MKMRVFGFAWVPDHLPKAVPASSVFERIAAVSGKEYGDYLGAVTKIDEWWAGVLLKIRDAKSFTKMRKEEGILTVSAEKLAEGEQLAETNFFLAHESNGHGLYCHHYLSASLIGDFGYYCSHRFAEQCKTKMEEAIGDPALSEKQKAKVKKGFVGRLLIEQVLKPGTFDKHVQSLKDITELDANLVSFELKDADFAPLVMNARRKTVSLGFEHHANMGQIAAAIVECRKKGLFERARVTGRDKEGREQIYKTLNDSQVFEQYEYDEMVDSLIVRFDDLPGSIQNSVITKKLQELVNSPSIRKMLGIK